MLMPLIGHRTIQIRGGKRDAVGPAGSGGFKMVFTLLTNVVAVQIKIFIIEVKELGLQQLLFKLCLNQNGRPSLILIFQISFYELLKQLIL